MLPIIPQLRSLNYLFHHNTTSFQNFTVMLNHLRLYLLFLLLTGYFISPGQEVTRVDNAYYIAKALCNTGTYKNNDSLAMKILGGVLWYVKKSGDANNIEFHQHMKKYATLGNLYYKMVEKYHPKNKLLYTDTIELRQRVILQFKNAGKKTAAAIDSFFMLRKIYDKIADDSVLNQKEISTKSKYRFFNNESLAQKKADLDSFLLHNDEQPVPNPDSTEEARRKAIGDLEKIIKEQDTHIRKLKADSVDLKFKLKNARADIYSFYISEEIYKYCILDPGLNPSRLSEPEYEKELKEVFEKTVSRSEFIISPAEFSPFSFKMPSQSEIIDALAIYLAKRVKQESVMWFFETLQKNAKSYNLVQTFFPEVISLLQSKEVYEIPNLGASWRYALSKDFVHMPHNLFSSEWLKKKLGSDGEKITKALDISWDIARMIEQKYSYKDIISSIYLQHNNTEHKDGLGVEDFISLLYSINSEFVKKDSSSLRWLKYEDLLYMSDEEFEVMMSLTDARYHGVFSKLIVHSETEFLKMTSLNQLRRWLGLVLLKVNQIAKLKIDFDLLKSKSLTEGLSKFEYTDYNTWKFLKDLLSTLQVNELNGTYGQLFNKIDNSLIKVMNGLVHIQEVYSQLQRKNFAGAVDIALHIVDSLVLQKQYDLSVAGITDYLKNSDQKLSANILKKDSLGYLGIKESTSNNTGNISVDNNSLYIFLKNREDQKAIKIIRNLAGFLNDVAQAENSKSLSKVVESYALPPGSYKRKRNSWKSIDLAAYVGLYGGYEITETTAKTTKNDGAVFGVTAPVGLSFSKTFGEKIKGSYESVESENPDLIKVGSKALWRRSKLNVTTFISIIDIGAVVSYRFNNQDTVLPQKIKWSQVISPGAHISLSIPGTPLVFSAGIQYTPQLRRIKSEELQRNSLRIYSGLLFDLPLLNLWTKSDIVKRKTK